MALREKLGRLVLIEETEAGSLGTEYRAARLSPTGLDRLVTVLRFSPRVCAHAEATRRLTEEARVVARLHGPGLVRVLGIGRPEQSFYVSTELVEGRSLAVIFERCHREAFPLAAEQALMIASRAASALDYVHGKKDETGRRLFHGLITPSRLIVTYDGEVKIKGLGLWRAFLGTDLLGPEDRLRLAPEQASGGEGDLASDVYALGLVLLEALTGAPPDGRDPILQIADASVTSTTGERGHLPRPLAELLRGALAREPSARFPGMAELRKALDALLFSGDFTPTTFDVAFFMHTLFREEMAREAAFLEEARRADYGEFVAEEGAAPGRVAAPEMGATTEPVAPAAVTPPAFDLPTPAPVASPAPAAAVSPPPPDAAPRAAVERPTVPAPVADAFAPTLVERDRRKPDPSAPAVEALAPEVLPALHPRTQRDTAREAASRLTFGRPAPSPREKRLLWLVVGVLAAVVVGGAAGGIYFVKFRSVATTPATTLSPDAVAAQARVRELEGRISELEREKAEAENQAAEKARTDLEAKAAAGGRAADPAAVAAAQELARRRAREEQEARQQAELARLAEARKAEEQRLAAEAARQPTPAPTPSPPAATPAPTEPVPALTTPATVPAPAEAATSAPTSSPSTLPASSTATAAAPPGPTPPAPTPTPQPATSTAAGAPAAALTGNPPASPAAPAESAPSPRPPVSLGALVDVNDPELTPPVVLAQTPAQYPPIAQQRLLEGSVELKILIDERGAVRDVTVVKASPRGAGFEDAAVRHARTRRYRPATMGNVPVKVWLPVVVNFRNPKG